MSTTVTTLVVLGGIDCLFNDVLQIHYRTRFRHVNEIANRLTCALFQLYISGKTGFNLWNHMQNGTLLANSDETTQQAQDAFVAFFLYDLVKLISTSRGRKQTLFLVHHVVSLIVLALNKIHNAGNNGLDNSLILILEAASPLLNIVKIAEEAAPGSLTTRGLQCLTKLAYMFTRQICLFVWLLAAAHRANASWVNRTMYASFCLVYAVSVKWTMAMIKKPH